MKGGSHDLLRINTTTAAASSSSISIFPKLKKLEIRFCHFWEEWEDISEEQQNNTNISIFPCLEILRLLFCPQLKALPHRLLHKPSSLQLLDIHSNTCPCLYSLYNPETGQDPTLLSHIPRVDFAKLP
ncbi:UNVERIFIED_CONTAM: hypothetical protein Slati_1075600 [Sesamum latifolium]|uniref:Uncharacterized protein n=1 Tax=Sesamum latifolium TaxID=2727402 RepID=A0AAW2XW65_9LAMI